MAASSLCCDIIAARCVFPRKASTGPCTQGLLVKLSQSDCNAGCSRTAGGKGCQGREIDPEHWQHVTLKLYVMMLTGTRNALGNDPT